MNQNPLNSIYKGPDNYHSSLQQQLTDINQTNNPVHYNNLDTFYNYTDSFPMTNNPAPCVNALNTVKSVSRSHTPQYDNCGPVNSGVPHSVDSSNTTFDSSQPQIIHKF